MATKPKVVYLRNVPSDLVNKLKAAAALSGGQSIQKYVVQLLLEHVAELERKGQLVLKGPLISRHSLVPQRRNASRGGKSQRVTERILKS